MRHRGGGRGPVPVLYRWRAPDHVARLDLLNPAPPFPGSANPGSDDKVLPCRVNVPGGSGPRLEGDIGAGKGRRILCGEQRVNTDIAGKIFGRPFDGRLRAGPGYRLRRFVCFGGQGLARKGACRNEPVKAIKTLLCISFLSPYGCLLNALPGYEGTRGHVSSAGSRRFTWYIPVSCRASPGG